MWYLFKQSLRNFSAVIYNDISLSLFTIFIKCSFSVFNTSLSIIYLCLLNSFEISSLIHWNTKSKLPYFADLEKKADEAIEQIEDRKYDMELRSEGYKNIFKYGIAFYKKDCLIKIKD